MEATQQTPVAVAGRPPSDEKNTDYWFSSIAEEDAGKFLGLKKPTMQKFRQTGDGPRFIRISARCIRYRRVDLRRWNEARLRKSTSDQPETEEESA